MRDDVEGDLLGELLGLDGRRRRCPGLLEQLVHARLAGAGDRLIGRDDDALDLRPVMQRLQRDDQLRGRAVGIGDDVLLGKPSIASGFTSGTISGTSGSMRQRAVVDDDAARRNNGDPVSHRTLSRT
jgi:hypothetical protein